MEKDLEKRLEEIYVERHYENVDEWSRVDISEKERIRRLIHEGLWPEMEDVKDFEIDEVKFFLSVYVLSCLHRCSEAMNMDFLDLVDSFYESTSDLACFFDKIKRL